MRSFDRDRSGRADSIDGADVFAPSSPGSRPGRCPGRPFSSSGPSRPRWRWCSAWAFGPDFDFFDLRIYYKAVSYWLNGNDIYDYWQSDPVNVRLGYTYPPAAAVLMAPMATLPVAVAAWITAAATALAGFACVWICLRAAQPRVPANAWQLSWAALLTIAAFQTQPWSRRSPTARSTSIWPCWSWWTPSC